MDGDGMRSFVRDVTADGQVTIPSEIRDLFDLDQGDSVEVYIRPYGDKVRFVKADDGDVVAEKRR
jgi:AbrB family looped-hinge helix DNA binding protein